MCIRDRHGSARPCRRRGGSRSSGPRDAEAFRETRRAAASRGAGRGVKYPTPRVLRWQEVQSRARGAPRLRRVAAALGGVLEAILLSGTMSIGRELGVV